MAHPARTSRFFGVVFFSPFFGLAQEPPPAAPVAVSETTAPTNRAVSPKVAALLAAATPRYSVAERTEKTTNTPSAPIVDRPSNDIVRLPNFVVREPRVPTPEAVRTPRGLELYAMKKYLGDPQGFSRGVLNRYTIAGGWTRATKHVPILNRFEWFSSPEKTALDMYYDDEVRKKLRDLYELQAFPSSAPARPREKPATPPASKPPPTGGK